MNHDKKEIKLPRLTTLLLIPVRVLFGGGEGGGSEHEDSPKTFQSENMEATKNSEVIKYD